MTVGTGGSEPSRQLAARLVVVVVAAGTLIPAAYNAAHAAHVGAYLAVRYRGADTPERRVLTAMEHLGAEMDARVPDGTRVWVDEPDEVWWFRMQELVTMHGLVLTKRRAEAELVLRRRADPAATAGVRLEITAVAG